MGASVRAIVDHAVTMQAARFRQEVAAMESLKTAPSNITLLTSLFKPSKTKNEHVKELFGALAVNLMNPHIYQVHVLLEASEQGCSDFPQMVADNVPSDRGIMDDIGLQKLRCAPVEKQPTYAEFFRYANDALAGRTVVLANTDIAFDETLGLLDEGYLADGAHAMVLSVLTPPYSSQYSALFDSECPSKSRCAAGKFDGFVWAGNSWDAYVFRAPLPSTMNLSRVDHVMNLLGGENRAAYEIEVAGGLELSNPCYHVHAYHWHCMGEKMHTAARLTNKGKGVSGIMPCWDCAGVALPGNVSRVADLCTGSDAVGPSALVSRKLRELFRYPDKVQLCCADGRNHADCEDGFIEQWAAAPRSLRWCRSSEDTDCFINHSGEMQHIRD